MSDVRYHLKVGDLLVNSQNGIFGIITKKTRHYFYFYINYKPEDIRNGDYMGEERASKQRVYESIDDNSIEVYYGTTERRRKRTSYQKSSQVEQEDNSSRR